MKAVRFYRGGRGSSFRTFAELCISRHLAGALAAARRWKRQPLSEAARGESAERASAELAERDDPVDCVVTRERLGDVTRVAVDFSDRERRVPAHALVGWSTGEAASRLGVRRRGTDNALQRAKRKLDGWQERWAA